jgi:hypothetical protein
LELEKINMKYHETIKKSELLLLPIISTDLLHVALESSGGPNDTRRHYNNENDPKEYFNLIQFLVERCWVIDEPSSLSVLLSKKTCTFTEAKIQQQYTPLGHALSNRRVSSDIVQYLCFICPEAIDIDCTLVVDDKNEYDISILALSIGGQIRNNNNDDDNEKRDLILRGSDFYKQKFNNIDTAAAQTTTDDETTNTIKVVVQEQLPPPDNSAIEKALRTVANYGEWQAVQNILLLLTYSNSNSNKDDDEKENNKDKKQSELEPTEPLWVTDIRNEMENYFRKKKRTKEMDRKRRKYFGVVMYDVDIIVDLISTVIPKRKRRNNNKRNKNKRNKNKNSRSHALDQRRRRNDHGGKMM